MAAGDVWGNSWSDSWTGWAQSVVAPVVEEAETASGGFPYPSPRYKTDEERREERIKLGIIPPDLPEPIRAAIAEVAEGDAPQKKLRELGRKHRENQAKLLRIAKSLREALDEFKQEQRLADAQKILAHLEQGLLIRRRNNAAVVLMMGAV